MSSVRAQQLDPAHQQQQRLRALVPSDGAGRVASCLGHGSLSRTAAGQGCATRPRPRAPRVNMQGGVAEWVRSGLPLAEEDERDEGAAERQQQQLGAAEPQPVLAFVSSLLNRK